MTRIYLDNAATSWPKPEAVYAAVDRFNREVGAAAGRGAYDTALEAGRVVARARSLVAELIGAPEPRRIVFTANGTDALNLAIHGMVRPGDHVVTTVVEHNSVLRPLAWLRDTSGVDVSYAPCDQHGVVKPSAIVDLIRNDTSLVAVSSASNVTGALIDVRAVGAACRERDVPLLVDAAQSLGHQSIDVATDNISLLASPGHKGLHGPLGTGLLYVAPGIEQRLRPLMHGGTGTNSTQETPPPALPERYEAGNLNVPAIAGLAAGIESLDALIEPAQQATVALVERLAQTPGVMLDGPPLGTARAPVVSFSVEGYDPQDVATMLATQRIECRAGLHCSPRMHQALGTDTAGGTVRLSPGWATTAAEIEQTVGLIAKIAASH